MSAECVHGIVPIPTTVEEARRVYLGFGKYNGQLITTVPKGYLKWLASNEPLARTMPDRARVAARILLEME